MNAPSPEDRAMIQRWLARQGRSEAQGDEMIARWVAGAAITMESIDCVACWNSGASPYGGTCLVCGGMGRTSRFAFPEPVEVWPEALCG